MAPRTLLDVLEHGAANDLALVVPGGPTLNYGQLREQVSLAADRLAHLGLRRQDRIAMVYPNGAEAILLFLAAATVGTAAPLNAAYKEDEFRFFLADIDARALILPPGESEAARKALPDSTILVEGHVDGHGQLVLESASPADPSRTAGGAHAEDVALVLHTSGTTSRPKLVPLRHRHLSASVDNIAATYALSPADVAMCIMPLFHIHGLMASTMATFRAGGTVVVPPRFDPLAFWPAVEASGATWYSAVPTIHQMLLLRNRGDRPPGAAGLRFIRSSSSALAPETMRQLESRFGAPVLEAYGMTEASHQMASNPIPPGVRKPGSVGRGTGVEVAIMDEGGRLQPVGETGEVVIKGPNVIDGYVNNPQADAAAFSDGWFRTGDQGLLDTEGYLSLVGRLKEMINRGGEKIAPREIDEVLLQHPAVVEAVAFGMPHQAWGEEVGAAVVLRTPVPERELLDFARERLADFKVPRRLFVVAEIPRTATGKIQRRGVAAALNPE